MLTKHDILTIGEASSILRVSKKTIYNLVKTRQIHAVKVGRGWRILRSSIENYLMVDHVTVED